MRFGVSNIFVSEPFSADFREYESYFRQVWKNNHFTNSGVFYNRFKEGLESFLGANLIELFCNGHLALESILRFYLKPGDEVITTPFTFASTRTAIERVGAVPIYCDIEWDSFNIDVKKIEKLITSKTKAIVPVHVFGNCCDVAALKNLADQYQLKIIYDAAHALGVTLHNQPIGSYGDASMFSLHATKLIHSVEGGICVTEDQRLVEFLGCQINFNYCNNSEYTESVPGGNAKLSELHAAVGLRNLSFAKEIIDHRRVLYKRYADNFSGSPKHRMQALFDESGYNYAYFPIVFESVELLEQAIENLNAKMVYPRRYFYPIVPLLDGSIIGSNQLAFANEISNTILALPLHTNISIQDIDNISEVVLGG